MTAKDTTDPSSGLDARIQAHTARLTKLYVSQARTGHDTPPHVLTEIEQIEAELVQLKQAAATPVSDGLVEQLGPTGRYQLWMSHIMRLDTDIGRLARMQERIDGKLDILLLRLAARALEGS